MRSQLERLQYGVYVSLKPNTIAPLNFLIKNLISQIVKVVLYMHLAYLQDKNAPIANGLNSVLNSTARILIPIRVIGGYQLPVAGKALRKPRFKTIVYLFYRLVPSSVGRALGSHYAKYGTRITLFYPGKIAIIEFTKRFKCPFIPAKVA